MTGPQHPQEAVHGVCDVRGMYGGGMRYVRGMCGVRVCCVGVVCTDVLAWGGMGWEGWEKC